MLGPVASLPPISCFTRPAWRSLARSLHRSAKLARPARSLLNHHLSLRCAKGAGMRKGRASNTAKLIAYYRMLGDMGITSVPGFSDPAARTMLAGRAWERAIRWAEKLAQDPYNPTRAKLMPHLDMIMLRVAFIDAVIRDRKPKQVVILGAGLDTRAYRLETLRNVHVIEVDHPDTQFYKRQRVGVLGTPIARLSFAPVDFTGGQGQLGAALTATGFDSQMPTLWLWEGVIMYLRDAALRETLATLRQLSAPGSTLIAHYHEPSPSSVRTLLKRVVLRAISEPQVGLRRREVMQREIERAGFRVIEDAGLPEQAARLGTVAPGEPEAQLSRILVASI